VSILEGRRWVRRLGRYSHELVEHGIEMLVLRLPPNE
jgi:hypothetical protein